MDEYISIWVEEMLKNNELTDVKDLTPEILLQELEEVEGSVLNEKISISPYQEDNILALQRYKKFLRKQLAIAANLKDMELIIGIYTDPDELPKAIIFSIPDTVGEHQLRATIARQRDIITKEDAGLCIEESFEEILNRTCREFGGSSSWSYGGLKSLHKKENLWDIKE